MCHLCFEFNRVLETNREKRTKIQENHSEALRKIKKVSKVSKKMKRVRTP